MKSWILGAALLCSACEPAVLIEQFDVDLVEVERCTRRGAAAESCEDPAEVSERIPVVVESLEGGAVTLFAADPETELVRAFSGTRRGDHLDLSRELSRLDEINDCAFARATELSLDIEGDALSGAERQIIEESAGCNELGLDTSTRIERAWRGERKGD